MSLSQPAQLAQSCSPRPVTAVVVVAMPEEAAPFVAALEPLPSAAPLPPLPGPGGVVSLTLPERPGLGAANHAGPRELVLVRSGIGLVNAASALATVLVAVQPELVISAGTTGGLGRQVEVGDVCVSDTLSYTDADATAFGYARGQVPGMPVLYVGDSAALDLLAQRAEVLRGATASSGQARLHRGLMLAGQAFVTAANVADAREVFPAALSTDMESTALAQVAAGAGLPFVSVRGVSDLCGPEAGQDFHIGVEEAATRSAALVLSLLA
ncbi:5'-methylthioadenosine/S-adenosylhomocysteine nucleosidase [Actinomyces bovis]|uniref:adenosylhomocysteine nucleosidase n=1 Tax=Actinomyces bovis TaxID=1658 RepID=A0ABY1VQY8_9ACTO|nr:5'-methylthioadenosine/S-adenosylhomocysteine nucleosidase [Actinomyces bovis]SPT54354.1 5'-methylthioadenosine/S-adenosylhomocysteine nucleosidase [Actinomyces bovis]VEG56128.1 5'-methylthioadenosine/S-adenosylhomocysteine nucleosidase [Actinomyces israelii]